MVFQCINIRQVPREVLKTAASGRGFQHLPRDLANVNASKTMFDLYIEDWIMYGIDIEEYYSADDNVSVPLRSLSTGYLEKSYIFLQGTLLYMERPN